jgi:DNA-binding response OmpR family regulator
MTTPPVPPTPPRAQVLVIEDDADTLATVGRVLTMMGIDALPVATCEGARHAAATLGRPDLVIADSVLPDGDGVACAAEFKARLGCRTLIYSGHPQPAEVHGVDAWLMKSADLAVLRGAVQGLVDGYAARRPVTR